MHNRIPYFISILIITVPFFLGCSTSPAKKYSADLVRTYAELLVFHEKEKMVGTTSDSLYQNKLKEFFAKRKMDKEEFEKQIVELSRNDEPWRSFLMEATVALDSIKSVKQM